MNILEKYKSHSIIQKEETFSLQEYLELCKTDPLVYATAPQRLLAAIGEPIIIDSQVDRRLGRIFSNRKVKTYASFADFYGIEEVIESIVSFLTHASQGLEEKKQILYLLGPVGSSKSSLAERLKVLMEKYPIYVIEANGEVSPVFDSPLCLFKDEDRNALDEEYGIPLSVYPSCMSPWAAKRLVEFDGDITKFTIRKIYPSRLKQVAIGRTEPSDENNQDISSLVGKVDIRRLERYSQHDSDAYGYSGALNRGNGGIVELVEIFKAPIKTLHPLLTATQEGLYLGTESIGAIPFNGIVLAHSNESEWSAFRNNTKNEAFLDRVCVIRVPYCLRIDEEVEIYEKLLRTSSLSKAPCSPHTLEMLAQFVICTRLVEPENSTIQSKMKIYNGEEIKGKDPTAKSLLEYKEVAGVDEGMSGLSTRFAFKVLSKVYNTPEYEISANPVHLLMVLEDSIKSESFGTATEDKYLRFIRSELAGKYAEFLGKELQKAYLDSYSDYGQNLFDRYLQLADFWLQNQDFRDPQTGTLMDRESLNKELEAIEKAAGIGNPRDFRNEVVNFVMRQKAQGKEVSWTSYEKLREVIEAKMFSSISDLLPVISFGPKTNSTETEKHTAFLAHMADLGYTEAQVRLLTEWYIRYSKHN